MDEYRVVWQIDISATDPEMAAVAAVRIMADDEPPAGNLTTVASGPHPA